MKEKHTLASNFSPVRFRLECQRIKTNDCNQLKTTTMKRIIFLFAMSFVAVIVLFISCEKEPTPITPTPLGTEVQPDYRLRWVGRYFDPYSWGDERVYISLVDSSDSLLHISGFPNHFVNKDVLVQSDGTFKYVGEHCEDRFIINGYFYGNGDVPYYGRDSLYIYYMIIFSDHSNSGERHFIKIPDDIPAPD